MHEALQSKTQTLDQVANEKSLEKTLDQFAQKKSPFKTFFAPKDIVSIGEGLGMQCIDHKTAAELAIEYDVDKDPYYTSKPYSMITFEKR